jgi:aspartyl-tRNA(Asn)/glutamyl-tRNA(Gln) amidotransferase subunit A
MKIDLKNLTIAKAHEAFQKGDFTAVELAQAYLDEIGKKNGEINAYLEVYSDVIEQAKEADRKIEESLLRQGSEGQTEEQAKKADFPMLLGIPFAIKDNILIKGRIASSASKILENYHATYDATVIEKLRKEGAVFIGRTNMDEFAMVYRVSLEDPRVVLLQLWRWTGPLAHWGVILAVQSVSQQVSVDSLVSSLPTDVCHVQE